MLDRICVTYSVVACMQKAFLSGHQRGFWHRWISADWLKQWADQGTTESIKNDPLLCSHGKLDPAKRTGLFLLSLPCLCLLQDPCRHLQQCKVERAVSSGNLIANEKEVCMQRGRGSHWRRGGSCRTSSAAVPSWPTPTHAGSAWRRRCRGW